MANTNRRSLVLVIAACAAAAGSLALRAPFGRGHADRVTAALETEIAEIEAGHRTTPIVGEQAANGDFQVTFLAKGPGGQAPRIVSDVTGWGENVRNDTFDFNIGRMARIGRTDWYALETRVAAGARIEYLVVHGRDYGLDPCNPRKTRMRGGGPASEFVTPGYTPPDDLASLPPAPAGSTVEATIPSRALGGTRRVIVYTPAGYRRDYAYPMAVFEQGVHAVPGTGAPANDRGVSHEPVIEAGVSPLLLDHLVARKAIEPIVAAFVESWRWGDTREYSSVAMRTFLGREVPAWVTAHFAVRADVASHAVLGVSAGAREAVEAAVASSSSFGRLGLLLPGRRVAREPDLDETIANAQRRLHVAVLAGRYDDANLATACRLRQAFLNAGDIVDYIEVAEGHNQAAWHDHMPRVLMALFKPAGD